MILLTPGPVSVKKNILRVSALPVLFHRAKPFQELLLKVSRKANVFFGADRKYVSLIISGSGTSANEAALASLVPTDKKLLVISNGNFGERLAEIAGINKIILVHLKKPWATAFSQDEVRTALKKHKPYMLAMAALETSTSMVNQVKEIGKLCKSEKVLFYVDAVSALGAEDIKVARDNIDVCVSVPNKALESLPGVGLVCVREDLLKDTKNITQKSYTLDLSRYYNWFLKGQTPATPPVTLYLALDKALDNFIAETPAKRRIRYKQLSALVRSLAKKSGARELINDSKSKATAITSLVLPDKVDVFKLHSFLMDKGLVVWFNSHTELGDNKNFIQVSVMGDVKETDIKKLFKLLSAYLKKL